MNKFWCQSCCAYASGKCPKVGHRSEELWLTVENKWKQYKPSKITEAKFFNGSIIHDKVS